MLKMNKVEEKRWKMWEFKIKMVVGDGFEPSKAYPVDLQSTAFDRSATPPQKVSFISKFFWLERVEGIEPSQSAWKADVLPLNYTRNQYSYWLNNP